MQRIIIFIVLCSFVYFPAKSVPAYPRKIQIKAYDRTLYITLHGDEHTKWAMTEDNYTLLPDSSGWVYAQEDVNGYAVPSCYKLSDSENHLKTFLSSIKKNIPVRKNTIRSSFRNNENPPAKAVTGNRRALVILMQFADLSFVKTYRELDALFNEKGYSTDGAMGSVHDFFDYASYGQLNFICDLTGPYTARHNISYYGSNSGAGGNDINPYALFREAIEYAAKEKDLSQYDADGDGYIDNIHIIFAGHGEEAGAPAYTIWSHEMTFSPITIQNMKINKYSCAPELRGNSGAGISRIGPHCHEMGHALGAMDYYDTDYSAEGEYEGTGKWDVMASGSWNNDGITPANFNPYVKTHDFGWCKAQDISTKENSIIGPSNHSGDEIYRINTPIEGEYYFIENRRLEAFDIHNPGEGLLIYHIHADIEKQASTNSINASHPQGCYIVCAGSSYSIPTSNASSYGNINHASCPFPGSHNVTRWNDETTPAAFCWDGTPTNIDMTISNREDENIVINFQKETQEEKNIVWKENFDHSDISAIWSEEIASGNTKWNILNVSNMQTLLDPLLPIPYDNEYAYVIKNNYFDTTSYINKLISPVIVPKGCTSTEISFYMQQKTGVKDDKNKLKLYYRENEIEEWILAETFSPEKNKWIECSHNLSFTHVSTIQLMFESTLHDVGSICIDKIEIKGKADESSISSTQIPNKNILYFSDKNNRILHVEGAEENEILSVYDLNGKLHLQTPIKNKECCIYLPSGIYIGVYDKHTSKIVVP